MSVVIDVSNVKLLMGHLLLTKVHIKNVILFFSGITHCLSKSCDARETHKTHALFSCFTKEGAVRRSVNKTVVRFHSAGPFCCAGCFASCAHTRAMNAPTKHKRNCGSLVVKQVTTTLRFDFW